jgi:hypothetical protein
MKTFIDWKPIREWGWAYEGWHYRKKDVLIILPKKGANKWLLRRVNSRDGKPLEPGEGDFLTRRMAFQEGNKLIKFMKSEAK